MARFDKSSSYKNVGMSNFAAMKICDLGKNIGRFKKFEISPLKMLYHAAFLWVNSITVELIKER